MSIEYNLKNVVKEPKKKPKKEVQGSKKVMRRH